MSIQTPQTRAVQFESGAVGTLPRTVNMFRGDVIYTHDLVKLPGPTAHGGLSLSLAARYQSNVWQAAAASNLDQPTSVLGLGWDLGLECVTADPGSALSSQALTYTYTADGVACPLIADGQTWQRATLSAAAIATLPAATPEPVTVDPLVVASFAACEIGLDPTATITCDTDGWSISDGVNQRLFLILAQGGNGTVIDGGTSFQLDAYAFWRIAYYPPFERWEMVTESGEIRSFGGIEAPSAEGFQQGCGNSIQWNVKWVDWTPGEANSAQPASDANWTGPSSAATSDEGQAIQAQYATGWYLASRSDRWGNQIVYGYNAFARDGAGCLGSGAEQLVGGGTGSLPFTKAVYLTSIKDALGTLVTLTYGNKNYTGTAQEYVDPHKALDCASAAATPPDNLSTPNSYQDNYETLYLSGITTRAPGGAILDALSFEFSAPTPLWNAPAGMGAAAAKRLLLSITQTSAYGESLPPYHFTYCETQSEATPNCGALETLTFPEGAVATWAYGSVSLPICDHQITIDAPSLNAQPYVFYGEDTAVVLWVSSDNSTATVAIYTWVGQWVVSQGWGAGSGQIYSSSSDPIVAADVQAVVGLNSVAIALPLGATTEVFLFGRNPAMPSNWSLDETANSITGTISSLAGGDNFVVAAQAVDGSIALYRWTWNWQSPATPWTAFVSDTNAFGESSFLSIISGDEYYLVAWQSALGQTSIAISFVDPLCNWTDGDTVNLQLGTSENPGQAMIWAAGPSCAACAFVTDANPEATVFTAALLRWNTSYTFVDQLLAPYLTLTAFDSAADPIPLSPVIVGNGFVGIRQYLFRFDQGAWQTASFDVTDPDPSQWLAFAYGQDVAICVINNSTSITSTMISYVPDDASASVSGFTAQTEIDTPLPDQQNVAAEGWPSVADDYFVVQNTLFFRGSSTDWSDATAQAVATIPATYSYTGSDGTDTLTVNSTSIVNGAPLFLSYLGVDQQDPTESQAVVLSLSGGCVPATQALVGSIYVTPDSPFPNGSGTPPAGPSTLTTFPETNGGFATPSSITLSRYTAQAITGPMAHYPVQSLVVTDGAATDATIYSQTFYEFNVASAACDPTGSYVKYFQSASYSGTASLAATQGSSGAIFGRTVFQFQNGYQDTNSVSMLDGLPLQHVAFSGAFLGASAWSDAYDLGAGASQPANQTLIDALSPIIALGTDPTITYTQIDGCYAYWALSADDSADSQYVIDYNGNPDDPAALRVFTGVSVSSTTTTYGAFFTRLVDPSQPAGAVMTLHGGYARPLQVTDRRDGVPLLTTYSYTPAGFAAPYSGGVSTKTQAFFNGAGIEETHSEVTTRACEVYPEAAALNIMSSTAAVQTIVATTAATVTATSHATTWGPYIAGDGITRTMPLAQYSWIGDPGGSDEGLFDFGATPSAFWIQAGSTIALSDQGLVTDSAGRGGLVHSTLYDASGFIPLATISNASFSAGQAAFTSFELYEDLSAWTLTGNAAYAADGRASAGCLSLPPGATATLAPLAPDATRALMLAAWCKTSGIVADGSGCSATIFADGKSVGAVDLPLTASCEDWTYLSVAIPLPTLVASDASDVSLALEVTNATGSGSDLLVDNLMVVPLTSEFAVHSYDPATLMPYGRIALSGRTEVTVRDGFQRPIGKAVAGSPAAILAPAAVSVPYSSRLGNGDAFAGDDPNARISLKAGSEGSWQSFRDGSTWANGWVPSDPAAFATANGILAHADATTGATLTASAMLEPSTDWSLYFELVPVSEISPLTLTDTFSLTIGEACLALAPGWNWTLTVGGTTVEPIVETAIAVVTCLVSCIDGTLMVHAGGQLLFSTSGTASGQPEIATGANALALRNLSILCDPVMTVRYVDGAGQSVQNHLLGGGEYTVDQTIYDVRGKPIVTTKPVPGLFGSGAAVGMPAYRPGLVDLPAFLGSIDATATMAGDAADWYDGSNAGASNDGGYPYSRKVLETAPTARVIEYGFPGSKAAIINLASTTPAERSTVQIAYSNSAETTLPAVDLPASGTLGANYQVKLVTTQRKASRYLLHDAQARSIGQIAFNGSIAAPTMIQGTIGNGVSTIVRLQPNAFALGESALCSSQTINAIGQKIALSSADRGATTNVYDGFGNLRFMQDAAAAAASLFTYVLYDTIGRPLAMGTVAASSWGDAATLAEEPGWPENSDVAWTRVRSWTWDGDGTVIANVGHPVAQSATTAAADDMVVTDAFTWIADGKIGSRTVSVSGGGSTAGSWTTGFSYDFVGRLERIEYPAVSGLGFVWAEYAYDAHGHVTSVTDDQGAPFVTTACDASGLAVSTNYGAGDLVEESITRDSLGRPATVAVSSSATTYSATLGYAVDGMPASLAETLTPTAANFDAAVALAYDDLNQLVSATDTDGLRSIAIGYAFTSGEGQTVDQNGNIQTITVGGEAATAFTYTAGTNQLAGVKPADAADAAPIEYDANGAVTSIGAGTDALVSYLTGLGLPSTISCGDVTLAFGYDADGRRVLKQSGDGTDLRIHAGLPGPLLTIAPDGTAKAWVYGPGGLIAMATGGARYAVVTDQLATPRLVFDDAGGLAASYAVNALGSSTATNETSAGLVPFLFTGCELDSETGLYDLRARLYDPALGRFLSTDPMDEWASPYLYVGNHSTALTDPSGELSTIGGVMLDVALIAIFIGTTYLTGGASAYFVAAAAEAEEGGATYLALNSLTSATLQGIGGAAMKGFVYSLSTPSADFSGSAMETAMISGAIGGFAGGAVAGGLGMYFSDAYIARQADVDAQQAIDSGGAGVVLNPIGGKPLANIIASLKVGIPSGIVSTTASGIFLNEQANRPWYSGLGSQIGESILFSCLASTGAKYMKFLVSSRQMTSSLNSASRIAVAAVSGVATASITFGVINKFE